ncbi:MAG: glycosyltransferase family 39 protein [Candidatus Zixiibacteriota bacterium]
MKAKILWVLEGELFKDPVTGYTNMHPPLYHLFLAALNSIGIPINFLLWIISILNVIMIFIFSFKINQRLFNQNTAIVAAALMPFIVEYMGCGNLLLPTAFYFGLPFFLIGVWLYLHPNRTLKHIFLFSIFWGLAFLISPVYIFLIGFSLIYELLINRNYRLFINSAFVLVIMLIPFFYQAYIVYTHGLFGTSAFSFWRGYPNLEYFKNLLQYIINPTMKSWSNPLIWIAPILSGLGIWGLLRGLPKAEFSRFKWFLIITFLAYIFTYYNFKPQYAIRIHLIISIFLAALAVEYLFHRFKNSRLPIFVLSGLIICGMIYHQYIYFTEYKNQNVHMLEFNKSRAGISKVLKQIVLPDEFIIIHADTYRQYILPFFKVHALLAYKSGEYFQLNAKLSDEMLNDYEVLMKCDTQDCINSISNKYTMVIAIASGNDFDYPVFQLINKSWPCVYNDNYFRIYHKP